MSSAPAKAKPAVAWFGAAALIFIAGVVVAIVVIRSGQKAYSGTIDHLARVPGGGSATLQFDHTGKFLAFYEDPGLSSSNLPDISIDMRPAGGTPVSFTAYSGSDHYHSGTRRGVEIDSFRLTRSGSYTVTVTGADAGSVAFGRDPFSLQSQGVLRGVLIGVLGLVLALALSIFVALKRGNSKRQIRSAEVAAYGWAAPAPTGFGPVPAASSAGYPTYAAGGSQGGPGQPMSAPGAQIQQPLPSGFGPAASDPAGAVQEPAQPSASPNAGDPQTVAGFPPPAPPAGPPGSFPPPPAGYPPQPGAYPPQPGAYPPQPGAYPQPPAAYPQPPAAYPQPTGYPPQPSGYPPQPPGYPQQPAGYPPAGYPQQPSGSPPPGSPPPGSPPPSSGWNPAPWAAPVGPGGPPMGPPAGGDLPPNYVPPAWVPNAVTSGLPRREAIPEDPVAPADEAVGPTAAHDEGGTESEAQPDEHPSGDADGGNWG